MQTAKVILIMSGSSISQADLDKALKVASKEIVGDVGQVMDVLMSRMDERFTRVESELFQIKKDVNLIHNILDAHLKKIETIQ